MRLSIRDFAAVTLVSFALAADAAVAGIIVPAVPGPVIGAGIPALIAFGWVYRRIKRSRDA